MELSMFHQLFNEGNNWGGDFTSTSGFIYSEDNGKTWKVTTLEGILPQGNSPKETVSTSESSVFYHKGQIYLAAKLKIVLVILNMIVKSRICI